MKEIPLSGMNVIGHQTCHRPTDLRLFLDYIAEVEEGGENEAGHLRQRGECGLNVSSVTHGLLAIRHLLVTWCLISARSHIPRMEPLFGSVGSFKDETGKWEGERSAAGGDKRRAARHSQRSRLIKIARFTATLHAGM